MIKKTQTSMIYKRPLHPDLVFRMLTCKIKQKIAKQKAQQLLDAQ